MEKLSHSTQDITQERVEKIAELFPDSITEALDEDGKLRKFIDFDVLRQNLSGEIVEGARERYQFTWPGKQEAKLKARRPISKTIRPQKEKSVNWDSTKNIYIEGNNLDALKILRNAYAGYVDLIYIDPPYNTTKDFIYKDNTTLSLDEYKTRDASWDVEGGCLVPNPKSNGRFHSEWCSNLYSTLTLARDFLTEDGAIFISIDDHELSNAKKICDEIFGEQNCAATFVWTKTSTPPSLSYKCRKTVEYVLSYEKKLNKNRYFGDYLEGGDAPFLNSGNSVKKISFPPKSIHFTFLDNGVIHAGKKDKVILYQDIYIEDGLNANQIDISGEFKWGQSTVDEEISKGTYFLVKTEKFSIRFQRKRTNTDYKTPTNLLDIEFNKSNNVGTNESASKELAQLNLEDCFDYPKPISLLKKIISMTCKNKKNAVVMDFFSGSSSTAHAVMQLNAEDGGNRKFIMVQLPSEVDMEAPALEKGYLNICEIGEERIRRAGKKIIEEVDNWNKHLKFGEDSYDVPDVGFRVFKVDSSNVELFEESPSNTEQQMLLLNSNNLKPGRTAEDLLFEALVRFRIRCSVSIEEKTIDSHIVFFVEDTLLIACFDDQIDNSLIEHIAMHQPSYAVFRDGSFDDATKTNLKELFNTLSPHTNILVF